MGYAERVTTGNCPVCGHSVVAWSPGEGVICYDCGTEEESKAWNCAAHLRAEVEALHEMVWYMVNEGGAMYLPKHKKLVEAALAAKEQP